MRLMNPGPRWGSDLGMRRAGLPRGRTMGMERAVSERRSEFRLADVMAPLVVEAERRGGVVKMDVDDAIRVQARATTVVEIVHRLLENARVHAEGTPVSIRADWVGALVHLHVTDAGPGLPAKHRARAVGAGWRRPDSPGGGLGLFIASELAREQGGFIRLEEGPEGGLRVLLALVAAPSGES